MQQRGNFGRFGFILAAAGSAVGLGNIWKFPYITYANDGGSFVLVYLLAIALIGAPIMLAEILIGRRAQKSPVGALEELSKESRRCRKFHWASVGWLGIASGFVILSFYSVVAGWTVYYFGKCLAWSWGGFTPQDAKTLGSSFGAFLGDGWAQVGFHAVFMGATMGVVVLGVKRGIERVAKVLLPVLVGILLLLLAVSTTWPGFDEAMRFLFHVGPISAESVLEAVGHAFFTLSLGMGAMITYGSYMKRTDSVPRAGLTVCALDTCIALLACMVMFSIIFSVPEAERASTFSKSAAILFTTLPRMFYELPGGVFLAPVFYLLVALAALTSTMSLLEVVVSYFIDQKGWQRKRATGVVGGLIFLSGVPAGLSLGASEMFSTMRPLGERTQGVFDTLDYLASNWMLPLGGLALALFTAWVFAPEAAKDELEEGHGPFKWFSVWRYALGAVCPLAIGWIIWSVIAGKSFS